MDLYHGPIPRADQKSAQRSHLPHNTATHDLRARIVLLGLGLGLGLGPEMWLHLTHGVLGRSMNANLDCLLIYHGALP